MTIEEMRARKAERGYTYEQIASLSGVPLGTVQKILGGMTRSPRYDTVKALKSFFMLSDEEIAARSPERASRPSGAATGHTVEEYRSLPEAQGGELIDGAVFGGSAQTLTRQRITAELFAQIRNYTDLYGVSDMVPLMSPVEVRPEGDDRTLLRPDLIVLRDPGRIKRWGVLGAPDLVIETLTPPARRRDGLKKLAKYADMGVREYWLIDTQVRKLIIYPLENDECLKVFKLDGRVPVGIFDDLLIDLKRVGELILDYPEE